jgi:hypothetical protein
VILREILIIIAASFGFAAAVAGYLTIFHGAASLKETLSTAFAAVIGLYAGRYLERRLSRG